MKETRADTTWAVVLAVLLHATLFALLFVGLWWTRAAAPAAAGAISAELLDASQLSPAMRRTLRERPEPVREREPEPLPEPVPEPVPEPIPEPVPEPVQPQPTPQDFIPVPDEVEQAEVTAQPTPTPAAAEEKEQEAKQRQAQVDLTELERQRQRQLEAIRRRRAAAAREADLAEQRLQQLASARSRAASEVAAPAAEASGGNGVDEGLLARYRAAIQAAVHAKWTRPDSVPPGAQCRLIIRQLPGGQVMSAEVAAPCAYDEQGRRSIEAAVLKAQPLPYAGFEEVFNRQLNMTFTAQDR